MYHSLTSLLQTWRDKRQPDIAHLAEALTNSLLAGNPRAALGASKKTADRAAWRAVESQYDPLDFPRLTAAARGGSQNDVHEQVQRLRAWNHPSFAQGLLTLLKNPPYAGIKSRPLLESIFEALEDTQDVRLVKPARALAKRYLSIVNSSTGGWIVSELERIAKAVASHEPPELSAAQRAEFEHIVQSLPSKHRPPTNAPEESGYDIDALLAEVYRYPNDDEKRLALAEALVDEGDERGEFITLQIAATKGSLTSEQQERLKTLATPARLAGWAQPLSMSGNCEFARGFPVAIGLYKTAMKSLGDPAWATIERIENAEKIPVKSLAEFLDHPCLANVKSISPLTAKGLASLDHRLRLWTSLTISDDGTLDAHLLRRCPELRELTLWLRGGKARRDPHLLGELLHLRKLALHDHGPTGNVGVCIPPTVQEAVVHGEVAPGIFADASGLEKLMLWPPKLASGHLEGLSRLTWLDVRAHEFDVDAFELVPTLTTLIISKPGQSDSLPERIFYPLRALKHIDLMYARISAEDLAPLQQLEEIRNHWVNINDVPHLPHLHTFHCMLPRTVTEIKRFLQRNPTVRHLEFCWNSNSQLWISDPIEERCEREWRLFGEVVSRSGLESWSSEADVRVVREGDGWRLEVAEKKNIFEWGFARLVRKIMETFGISADSLSPALRAHVLR